MSNLLVGSNQGKFTGKFTLTADAKEAFENLKDAFTTAPILRHYDPELPIRMVTDSSGFAVAAILSQLYIVERAMRLTEATDAVSGNDKSASTRIH